MQALDPWAHALNDIDPQPHQRPPDTDPTEWASPAAFAERRSRGQWRRARHLDLIETEALHTIEQGGRLIVSVSVRHGKSEFIARWLAAWFIARHRRRVILATGEANLARAHGRAARDIVTEWGHLFDVSVSQSSKAADEWELAGTGGRAGMRTIGVGGSPIGRGADLLIVDDPFRNYADAMSPLVRRGVQEWWTGTMVSRIEPGGAAIVICARWHEDDLSGFLLRDPDDHWREIRLPAVADSLTDPLGRRPGEPLWAERYDAEALARMEREMSLAFGPFVWLAQAQQRPTTPDGGKFPESKWVWADSLTLDVQDTTTWCRAWDLAATDGGGDWTVGVLIGRTPDGGTIIADVRRGQWSDLEVERQIIQAAGDDGRHVHIELPQDPGQAGKAQAKQLVRKLAGWDVRALPQTGSKELRATGLAAQQQAGQVTLVRGAWNGPFVVECKAFPTGRHDDQVDAAATGFNWLAEQIQAGSHTYTDRRLKGRR